MARFGGNRFGGGSGGGSLRNRMMQDELMSMIRKKQAQPAQAAQQGGAMGGPTPMPSNARMIGSMSSGGSSEDFNKRNENRARFGRFNYRTKQYEGGLERDLQNSRNKSFDKRTDAEAKSRARENLGKYGGMDEWGRPVKGTEVTRAGNEQMARQAQMIKAARGNMGKQQTVERTINSPQGPQTEQGVLEKGPNGGWNANPVKWPGQQGQKPPGAINNQQQGLDFDSDNMDFSNPMVQQMIKAQGHDPNSSMVQAGAQREWGKLTPDQRRAKAQEMMGGGQGSGSNDYNAY
jgi:hypothetical protein